MSGALKWSPFESARWPSAQDGAGRNPSQFAGSNGRSFESTDSLVPVLVDEEVSVDEYVDKEALVVRAHLPGADPDTDIEVSVAGGVLHIRAGHEQSGGRSEGTRLHSGQRYRPFARNLPLPEGVTDEDIKVSFRDGVLEVRTPLPVLPGTDAAEKRLPISHD
ncbi:Hsp20/alpha crystallin family protein [Arthrobacter sp. LjRoot78]|uniref:Hsp20/alpha crystallin family protein n=1 Tax=Arthrobacter sp. LjRoot78 TaxID=3342338 RepID=UPI003ED092C3